MHSVDLVEVGRSCPRTRVYTAPDGEITAEIDIDRTPTTQCFLFQDGKIVLRGEGLTLDEVLDISVGVAAVCGLVVVSGTRTSEG